jgi:hypothetical protein
MLRYLHIRAICLSYRQRSSSSRSGKAATKRRRRQCRAVPGRRSPASGPGRRRDGVPAADPKAWRVMLWSGQGVRVLAGIGCRRRGPCWRCSIAGSSAGSLFPRSVKPATRRRRRQCRAVPGRRSPASGPGRRRDGAPAADRACRGLVVVSGGWQAAVAGVCSCWRCCGQWRAAHRAAPGRRSPASEPGRRPDGTPAADRACRGLVKVSVCWQASVAGVCQGSRRRGSCWWCCGQGVQLVGQHLEGDHRQVSQGEGQTAHRQPIGRAVAWSWCRVAGKPRLQACARAGGAVVSGVQLIEQHLEGDRRQVSQGEGQTAHRQPIGRAVAWSGSRGARSPAVLPGLRSLDR